MACFLCLDESNSEKKTIDKNKFTSFMKEAYMHKKRYIKEERLNELYKLIDTNESNSISVNEFFELLDILEKNKRF